MKKNYNNKQVYFVGGGLASLAGAAYLIRDCGFDGKNIHVLEGMSILGGSNDGGGNPTNGFVSRGGRMLNEETYENFWELFSSIPSLEKERMSVTDEILEFDHAHSIHSNARLIDRNGNIVDVMSMKFNTSDRKAITKLLATPEKRLDNLKISDWFGAHFFETNFWYMWQTTFAFQKWSSLFEFRRYMNRMMHEFSRIQTLEGITKTPYNQYESIILPIKAYLDKYGVDFNLKCTVTDLDFKESEDITVTAIHYTIDGINDKMIQLRERDLCIVTNGCMTDNSSLGDFKTTPSMIAENSMSYKLWSRIAAKKEGLGNPKPFFENNEKTNWESFTVTLNSNKLLKIIEKYSRNVPGSGGLMTFKDSKWLLSIVVAVQPHFKAQRENQTVFWGYALNTNVEGDYIKKPMRNCTGEEILIELLHHLHLEEQIDEIMEDVVNVIPCMMPYIISMFQPRTMSDRPKVVPKGSTNLAMIGQFTEIPEDMVFTEEYSVRTARMAVYTLLDLNKKVCPVTPYCHDVHTIAKTIIASYR